MYILILNTQQHQIFIDEAYDLDPANNLNGRAILAEIMSVAEDHHDTVTIMYSIHTQIHINIYYIYFFLLHHQYLFFSLLSKIYILKAL